MTSAARPPFAVAEAEPPVAIFELAVAFAVPPLRCTVPKTLLRAASCHVLFCRTTTGGTPMPSFTWDHCHLRTPDPEGTAQWFERMFGAEVIRSTQQGKPRIDIRLGGAMIFTAQVNPGDGVNPPPTTPYQGLDHFGFAVSGIDDIAEDLKKKGVEFTREPHSPRPGIKIGFLGGARGISIELLDRDPKYS